ncbi:alpha/beta fold hydrolase [Zavarzinia sp. CC-PAN008]|uniref:alpha/beta fold hydrolase n=1 Tax=Zavarzinia sp. CC-PAN008 TaxID=3243332 RepID=UPI003F748582
MSAPIQSIAISDEFQPNPVMIKGDGRATVFLHGLLGPEWDPLLDRLASGRRVYAPAHVGSSEPDELRHVDGIYELILYYDELFERLGLTQVDLVGHSFGGMVAAELAAAFPARVRKLVLIDALGLWRDEAPVEDYLLVPPETQIRRILGDPARPDIQARLQPPEDPEAQIQAALAKVTALASVSHFLWAVPERGLVRRLHRIKAPTLVLWGADDALVPSLYARDFGAKIRGSEVRIIDGAGHTPHLDKLDEVAAAITGFLDV